MLKQSNLENIKSVAKAFLYIDVEETKVSPIIVQHPIFENGIQALQQPDYSTKLINILEDKKGLEALNQKILNRIDDAKNVWEVYMIIRKSYRLTFVKYIYQYLSIEDMSKLLAHAWVTSENPNNDNNVSIRTLVSWFKKCDKKVLMDEYEYSIYQSLPDKLKIYRGVAVNRNPKGLSWTNSFVTAEWFAHRFDNDKKEGYVQSAVIDKKDILAYFNTELSESEIVVDSRKLNIERL